MTHRADKWLPLALILTFCMLLAPALSSAEEPATWSSPTRISTGGRASGALITADPYGEVHVVWTEASGRMDELPDTVYYARLTNEGWTTPIDVIATSAPYTAILNTLDTDGQAHLVLLWYSGNRLMLSRAPIAEASDARAWTSSVVAEPAGPAGGSLQVALDDFYHLTYASSAQDLVYASSSNYGNTWASQSPIVHLESTSDAIDHLHLATDQAGYRYTTWTQNAEEANWGPAGVWFARSTDSGASWSSPVEISSTLGHGWPALLVDAQGIVRLFWIGNLASGGRYEVVSIDHGATFSKPTIIAPPEQVRGYAGQPQPLEDNSQSVHLVFGGLGNNAPDSIWYTRVRAETAGGAWIPLSSLSAPSPDSQMPAAAMELGHFLHVVWIDYSENAIYYSGMDTGAPALTALPRPRRAAPTLAATSLPQTAAPAATATSTPDLKPQATRPANGGRRVSDATVLALSIVPPLFVVGAMTVISLARRRR